MNNAQVSLKYSNLPIFALCMLFLCLSVFLFLSYGPRGQKEKSITLIWWEDVYNRVFTQKVVDRYNSKNPTIKLKLLAIEQAGGAYESKSDLDTTVEIE